MAITDRIKNLAKRLTEARPDEDDLRAMVRSGKPLTRRFAGDGIVPNHPEWPLVLYRSAVRFRTGDYDNASVLDALFAHNGWGRSWRNGIYDYVHYHSKVHEVLGVAAGSARVEFGGLKGRVYRLKAGDVAVLPAGTGHRLIEAGGDFLVVGAYPPEGAYDECTDTRDWRSSAEAVAQVERPATDPVHGKNGPLLALWR